MIPDDIKALAEVTLAHRIIASPSARIRNVIPDVVRERWIRVWCFRTRVRSDESPWSNTIHTPEGKNEHSPGNYRRYDRCKAMPHMRPSSSGR